MNKKIIGVIMFILMINMGIVVNGSRAERMIRVYGTVTIDGEGVDGADILVQNMDKGYEETTKTNGSGYYEVFIKAVDSNKIKVSVSFDEYSNDKSFVLEKFQSNYEVNFDFESSPSIIVVNKFVDWIYGFDLLTFLTYFLLIVFILCLCKKLLIHGNHYKD